MAKLIRCPKCQSQIDVTSVPGGATVRCADCDALIRVPTGSTGVYPKVGAATAAPAGAKGETKVRAAGGSRQTDLYKKMSGARSPGGTKPPRGGSESNLRGVPRRGGGNNTMLIVGISVGAVVILVVLLTLQLGSQERAQKDAVAAKLAKNEAIKRENARILKEAAERDAADEAAAKAEEAAMKEAQKKGGSGLKKKEGGGYDIPATFEPGARKMAKGGFQGIPLDAAIAKEFEAMAAASRTQDLVKDVAKWMPYIIEGMVSDAEPVARGSYLALQEFCNIKGIKTESGANPIRLEFFNSSYARGQEYTFWRDWWDQPQNRIAIGAGTAADAEAIRTKGEDPEKFNWDEAMKFLRAGGGFEDEKRPEGKTFARVKSMGPKAYPFLIRYIDNEDLALGKAAVTVLNALTNRQVPMPNEGNKGQIKAEWENWIKNN